MFRKIRVKNSTDIILNMSSAERQRLHRANLSDVERVNNRNRDNASRNLARGTLTGEEIEDIRVHDSASRNLARATLTGEEIEDIRVHDSASRNLARAILTGEEIEDIRVHDSASRNLARSNLPNHNLNGLFWGSLNDIRQRVEVPDDISYYRDAQQVSGHAIFLSHEFTGIVQLEMSGDFLQTEEAFQATLTHMETIKVFIYCMHNF